MLRGMSDVRVSIYTCLSLRSRKIALDPQEMQKQSRLLHVHPDKILDIQTLTKQNLSPDVSLSMTRRSQEKISRSSNLSYELDNYMPPPTPTPTHIVHDKISLKCIRMQHYSPITKYRHDSKGDIPISISYQPYFVILFLISIYTKISIVYQ